MIFIFGRRRMRIKKYNDSHIKCNDCNSFEQQFSVYQDYFHVFFVPIFPLGAKTIKSACLKCNDTSNDEKRAHYLSITRRPIYLYTGLILLVVLILALVMAIIHNGKQKEEYLANPKINDVYLMREDENKSSIYYFLKVKNIETDTIELLHGNFEYYHFVSRMSDSDYFLIDETYRVAKSDLINPPNGIVIHSIERDYDKSSRFTIEK